MDHAIEVVVNQACSNMQFLGCRSLRLMERHAYAEMETESNHRDMKSLTLLCDFLAPSKTI